MNGKIKILSIILVIVALLAVGTGAVLKFLRTKDAQTPSGQQNQQTSQNNNNASNNNNNKSNNQLPGTGGTLLPEQQNQQQQNNEQLKETVDTEYKLFLGLRSYTEPPHDPAVKVIPSNIVAQYPGPSYRTLIVDFKNAEKPIFETQDLYFFKNGQLWNVGVVRTVFDKQWMEDLLFAAPMNEEPYLQKADYNRLRISGGTDTTIINYVTKDLISLSFATDGTDPGINNNWSYSKLAVLPVANMSNLYEYNLLFSEVFGENGKKVMLEESNKAYSRSKNSDRLLQYSDEANWGMLHAYGRLYLVGRLDYNAEVGKGYFEDYIIPLDPAAVSNYTAYPSWEVILQKVSGAEDAVSSPDNKVIAVKTKTELIFYRIIDEQTWNEILRIPLKENEQIIMSEWNRNTEELQKILDPFTMGTWYERLIHNY